MQLLCLIDHRLDQSVFEKQYVSDEFSMFCLILRQIVMCNMADTLKAVGRRNVRTVEVEHLTRSVILMAQLYGCLCQFWSLFYNQFLDCFLCCALLQDDVLGLFITWLDFVNFQLFKDEWLQEFAHLLYFTIGDLDCRNSQVFLKIGLV